MSREWDDMGSLQGFQDFISQVFTEAIRVLKPGGHALVWAIPRTAHHTAMGLEKAGFKIRDCVTHCFGSGFPKSLDIGKAVDKRLGNKRKRINEYKAAQQDGSQHWQTKNRKNGKGSGFKSVATKTSGNTKYEGWGSALKPAIEFWWLARKPLSEPTIAKNVLKHGTGGLAIDKCRVAYESEDDKESSRYGSRNDFSQGGGAFERKGSGEKNYLASATGRFPANLIWSHHPDCKLIGTKEKTPDTINTKNPKTARETIYKLGFSKGEQKAPRQYGDGGDKWQCVEGCPSREFPENVSRFFKSFSPIRYCPKVSKGERNKGLEWFEDKQTTGGGGGIGNYLDDINSASGKYGSEKAPSKNSHPTVKPVELMRYLCRLITPPKGIVLDMFMGSGSTGVAAKMENFEFIGIEKDLEYVKIARARIDAVQDNLFSNL